MRAAANCRLNARRTSAGAVLPAASFNMTKARAIVIDPSGGHAGLPLQGAGGCMALLTGVASLVPGGR
jgi:hypothetical protein